MSAKYILNDAGEPVLEHDLIKWAKWFESDSRKVAFGVVGEAKVSTVFLGLDHSFGSKTPVLWETMVFGTETILGLPLPE